MRFVDLHSHSTASDGTLTPGQVVQYAADAGLSAMSLTDHDTTAGIAEAQRTAAQLQIDFLPGIEISAQYPRPGTLHLLGYGIDPNHSALIDLTQNLNTARRDRNLRIIARLNELGVSITLDEVLAGASGTVGRPHIAQVLVQKGYVKSKQQAFDKYLGQAANAYEDKETITPARAIAMIHAAKGLAVLAHPSQLKKTNTAELAHEIKTFTDFGLDGIEVIHSDHSDAFVEQLEALARQHHLLCTGGSDFHGEHKPLIRMGYAGARRVPRAYYEALVERLK
jgi:3',5'-nucleoside bisphosphate phosphatase